jgi:hypothetical protein
MNITDFHSIKSWGFVFPIKLKFSWQIWNVFLTSDETFVLFSKQGFFRFITSLQLQFKVSLKTLGEFAV